MGVYLMKRAFRWCAGRPLTPIGCRDMSFFLQGYGMRSWRAFCLLLSSVFLCLCSQAGDVSAAMKPTMTLTQWQGKEHSMSRPCQHNRRSSDFAFTIVVAVWHAAAMSSDLGFWSSFLTDSFLPCRHTTINYRFESFGKGWCGYWGYGCWLFPFWKGHASSSTGESGGDGEEDEIMQSGIECRN